MAVDQDKFKDFQFLDPGCLVDDDLELSVKHMQPYSPSNGYVPAYEFEMIHAHTQALIGTIDLRVVLTDKLKEFGGHLGYEVAEQFRGNHYASRSCKLLFPLSRRLGINPIVITCDPKNIPSVKTIESLGAKLQITKEVQIQPQVYRMTSIYHLYI